MDVIDHGICYIFGNMIRSLLICSALVVSSSAGAVALSMIHDSATADFSGRSHTLAEEPTVDARFVIPSYAPARAPEPVVIQASLETAPTRIDVPSAVPTQVAFKPVTVGEPGLSIQDALVPSHVVPAPKAAVTHTPAAEVAAAPVRSTPKARDLTTRHKSAAKRRAPVIVAQAPAFRTTQISASGPDYLIGVFR